MLLSYLRRLFQRSSLKEKNTLPAELETIYKKAVNGHTLEQVLWGKALLNSHYIPHDHDKAREWFYIAASSNYGPAHNMLGRCSHFGWGCPLDLLEAAKHYERAANVGDLWGTYNLAILYMRGLGVEQNMKLAFTLFRRAALKGHPKSMNLLARFIEEGWETPANPSAALEWYRRSAEGGDYRGQHNYATALLSLGKAEEALHFWRQAVKDATPDILLAMQRELSRPHAPRDPELLAELNQKLTRALEAAKTAENATT